MLLSANLPRNVFNLKQADVPKARGDVFFAYLASGAWQEDRAANKGMCISGHPNHRSDMLKLLAKSFALSQLGTYYVTLHRFQIMLEDDDGRQKLERVDNLFIDHFETSAGQHDEFPFTHYQRFVLEKFLEDRREEETKGFFFSSSKPWQAMTWWSKHFINRFEDKMVDITTPY